MGSSNAAFGEMAFTRNRALMGTYWFGAAVYVANADV
jgi:hypothetical protein